MILRMKFNALMGFLKDNKYEEDMMKWYQDLIYNLLINSQKLNVIAAGIAL